MVFVREALLSGIGFTQVGYPLAHGLKDFLNATSSDRFTAHSFVAESEGKDEHVGELFFLATDSTEGRGDAVLVAEVRPHAEDFTG